MKAEKWLGLIALTAALFTFLAVVASFNAKPALIKDNLAYVIVIDAGHGGIDGGVTGVNTNVKESEINLLIAEELKEIFEINGFTALLTRSDDNGLYGDTSPGFKKGTWKHAKNNSRIGSRPCCKHTSEFLQGFLPQRRSGILSERELNGRSFCGNYADYAQFPAGYRSRFSCG